MKSKEYARLNAYHGVATALVNRINRLDGFLRGLQYRLREKPAAELEVAVRRVRGARHWDAGVNLKLPVDIVGELLLSMIKTQLADARKQLRELPPIQVQPKND